MTIKEYAFIKDSEVINIALFEEPTEEILNLFKNEHGADFIVEATSQAVVGGTYDGQNFWIPQPFPSWIKNEETNNWQAPVPMPEHDPNGHIHYRWDEEVQDWVIISQGTIVINPEDRPE